MLSPTSAQTVAATLPAVGGALDTITTRFYERLFAAHPELLRDLFNRGNQANGAQSQALAGAVAAFAGALLAHPDQRPDAMLARIAHKHVSLGIAPAQYEVVYTHLFGAIAEVLGEAVTEEVAAAWTEVYWLMANALIALEASLYQQAGTAPGEVSRRYRVVGRRQETDEVVAFRVAPVDGGPLPAARPGQYVSVQVELADGARQIRQYSLLAGPEEALEFAVKRDGEVSAHLHDHAVEGTELSVSAPCGDVVLEEGERPVLLASAGIGCTPMIGMLQHLAGSGAERRVLAVHGDRSPATHAFSAEFAQLTAKLPAGEAHVWYEVPGEPNGPAAGAAAPSVRTGLVDVSALEIPAGTVAYLCGPLPFLRAVRAQLLEAGVAAADIHYEVFGPDLWLADGDAA